MLIDTTVYIVQEKKLAVKVEVSLNTWSEVVF